MWTAPPASEARNGSPLCRPAGDGNAVTRAAAGARRSDDEQAARIISAMARRRKAMRTISGAGGERSTLWLGRPHDDRALLTFLVGAVTRVALVFAEEQRAFDAGVARGPREQQSRRLDLHVRRLDLHATGREGELRGVAGNPDDEGSVERTLTRRGNRSRPRAWRELLG